MYPNDPPYETPQRRQTQYQTANNPATYQHSSQSSRAASYGTRPAGPTTTLTNVSTISVPQHELATRYGGEDVPNGFVAPQCPSTYSQQFQPANSIPSMGLLPHTYQYSSNGYDRSQPYDSGPYLRHNETRETLSPSISSTGEWSHEALPTGTISHTDGDRVDFSRPDSADQGTYRSYGPTLDQHSSYPTIRTQDPIPSTRPNVSGNGTYQTQSRDLSAMISPSNGQSASGLEHEYSESQSDGQHSRICSYCGLQFHGEWALRNVNRHIESKHPVAGPSITTENGEAVYRCGACDNKYRRKDARLKHERCRHPELQRPPAKPRRKPDEA